VLYSYRMLKDLNLATSTVFENFNFR